MIDHGAHLFQGFHFEVTLGDELVQRSQIENGTEVTGFLRNGK
ncbi:MAG TPA: hypothetical protein VNV63_01690 [Nitrospiria bacterium]|nr:hypothetical protein [Nitrospiria bacterium]